MEKRTTFVIHSVSIPLFILLLFCSCAPVSYDFIGSWNRQDDKVTYINEKQNIRITFPDRHWRVYTTPQNLPHTMKKGWKMPSDEDDSYHALLAIKPKLGLSMQLIVFPLDGEDISLDELLAEVEAGGKMGILEDAMSETAGRKFSLDEIETKTIVRNGRRVGICAGKVGALKFLFVFFAEKDRFSGLMFGCVEKIFESRKNEFWAITDSYEYLE